MRRRTPCAGANGVQHHIGWRTSPGSAYCNVAYCTNQGIRHLTLRTRRFHSPADSAHRHIRWVPPRAGRFCTDTHTNGRHSPAYSRSATARRQTPHWRLMGGSAYYIAHHTHLMRRVYPLHCAHIVRIARTSHRAIRSPIACAHRAHRILRASLYCALVPPQLAGTWRSLMQVSVRVATLVQI